MHTPDLTGASGVAAPSTTTAESPIDVAATPIIGAESSPVYVPALLEKPIVPKSRLRIFIQRVAQVILGLVVSITPIVLLSVLDVWLAIATLAIANIIILICFRLMDGEVSYEVYLWVFMNLGCVATIYHVIGSAWAGLLILAAAWFFWP